jgi:hypothetical protein
MGSKSQVRSMQRGAQKRDRAPMSKESDYGKLPPKIREEDRAHLGLTEAAAEKMATTLTEKIRGYARAGFRKPADVSRLLNKEGIKTAAGAEWNPPDRLFPARPDIRRQPAQAEGNTTDDIQAAGAEQVRAGATEGSEAACQGSRRHTEAGAASEDDQGAAAFSSGATDRRRDGGEAEGAAGSFQCLTIRWSFVLPPYRPSLEG